jgi:hypothetical protein
MKQSLFILFFIIAGIWIWGTPVEMEVDGSKVSVIYLDTEGFESVGKSNVYDDRFVPNHTFFGFTFLGPRIHYFCFLHHRIFALATVLSSVLIYNLPETVREADISRLSFAVEIAEEFYGRFAYLFLMLFFVAQFAELTFSSNILVLLCDSE